MWTEKMYRHYLDKQRSITKAQEGDDKLGPLKLLPGVWKNQPSLPGRGWNMIALPFDKGPFNYRVLVNQYDEELKFTFVDDAVPNRGVQSFGDWDDDQFLVALDYEQTIIQSEAADSPESGKAGGPSLPIHHEPGLWLHMLNKRKRGMDIARLATVPHGNSVMALGESKEIEGAAEIPEISGLPIGVPANLDSPYLEPYKFFNDNLFKGLFNPVAPNALLVAANQGVEVVKTTVLEVDTTKDKAGISNIPFIEREADATSMKSTFWIQELAEKDQFGNPKLRMQYSQVIFLDFFERRDGMPGLISWPHVSINTMEKVPEEPA